MQLTQNFSREEFKCKCGVCDYDTVDFELVFVLQSLRDHFSDELKRDVAVRITSGNRCPDYNRKVSGAVRSYHPRGRAADIQVDGVTPEEVFAYLSTRYHTKFGLGLYKSFVHIDTRSWKARWKG